MPRLRTLLRRSAFLSEDIGSVLKGGAKVCQRQLVNEVLGPLVTEFVRNLGREGATPIQGGFNASLLGSVQGIKRREGTLQHAILIKFVNAGSQIIWVAVGMEAGSATKRQALR
jgi:hypothetical protein